MPTITLNLSLTEEQLANLSRLAEAEMRTMEAQAAWILTRFLNRDPRTPGPVSIRDRSSSEDSSEGKPEEVYQAKLLDPGVSWQALADRFGYKNATSANSSVRNWALAHGKSWPLGTSVRMGRARSRAANAGGSTLGKDERR